MTWRELLARTRADIGDIVSARWLCETASGLRGDEFLAELDTPVTQRMVAHLDSMLERYRVGEPLAYVLGSWSFRRIEVMVDDRVLIPRPETEIVAGRAIDVAGQIDGSRRVVDLGTGSGAIGLSMAVELPLTGTEVWMTDVSMSALDVARANCAGIGRAASNVRIGVGSWFDALPEDVRGTLDVVVSNPPYIADDDPEVDESVKRWEPAEALFAGHDGLREVRVIVGGAQLWLRPGGWLIVEIGHRQGSAVRTLFDDAEFESVQVHQDLTGRDRYVEGRRGVVSRRRS